MHRLQVWAWLVAVGVLGVVPGCGDDDDGRGGSSELGGSLVFACDFPAEGNGRHACTDSHSNHDLGPGRATLEGVCTSSGGMVVNACPDAGKVGACALRPPGDIDYGVTTIEWAYAPRTEADVRSECARRGYDFVNHDGRVEPAADGGTDGSSDETPPPEAGRSAAGRGGFGGRTGGAGGGGGAGGSDAGSMTETDVGAVDGPSPTAIPVAISVGDTSAALLYDNGEVRLFGDYNNNRICGALDPNADVIIAGTEDARVLRGAIAVDSGQENACIVLDDGTVRCCGANGSGQRGVGRLGNSLAFTTPVATSAGMALTGVTQVSMGFSHGCARRDDGSVSCWGDGSAGATGSGEINAAQLDARPVVGTNGTGTLEGVRTVSAGIFHSCAATDAGRAMCWGSNTSGQLGRGAASLNGEAAPLEAQVESGDPLDDVIDARAGFTFSCALDAEGMVWCWGSNARGQLGSDHDGDRPYADRVLDTEDAELHAEAISVGVFHACALLEGGRIACWGANNWAQLGDGTTTDATRATLVPGIEDAIAVSAGGTSNIGAHTCALWADGTVQCWGSHDRGQLGMELPGTHSTMPVIIEGI